MSMQWVSHRNHRGNICAVDFIWLLNPDKYRKLLKASWSEAVFGMFKVINHIAFGLGLIFTIFVRIFTCIMLKLLHFSVSIAESFTDRK